MFWTNRDGRRHPVEKGDQDHGHQEHAQPQLAVQIGHAQQVAPAGFTVAMYGFLQGNGQPEKVQPGQETPQRGYKN